MDILLVVLRLIHILAAVAWVGMGITMMLYIGPAAGAAGESGLRFMKSLTSRTGFVRAIPMFAGIAVLAGILLYLVGNAASHFSQTGNIVLGAGALLGLVAIAHGGAVTGRATQALAKALVENVPDDGPIPADALPKLRQMSMQLATHSRVSTILMVLALVCMGSARYL
jgi:uncharacterized membrane protein